MPVVSDNQKSIDIFRIPGHQHIEHLGLTEWKLYIHRLEGAYAPNTIKAYYAEIVYFVDRCDPRNLIALPTSCNVIQIYLEEALSEYALTTIKRRLYAVHKINMLMGLSDSTRTEDFYLAFGN